MRKTYLSFLVILAAIGCGKKEQSGGPPLVGPVPGQGQDLYGTSHQAPLNYAERSVDDWRQQLFDPDQDHVGRRQAAEALAQLGDGGFPPLKEALASSSPEIRVPALEALSPAEIVKHDKETVPLLVDMLKDPNPAVREQAAFRLSWFDQTTSGKLIPGHQARERYDALFNIFQNDPNRSVQLAARNSLMSIYDHMRGRLDCPPGASIGIEK